MSDGEQNALDAADRAHRLAQLRTELEAAGICGPLDGATRYVFGEGNPEARLMLVGEAPGEQEDRVGRPFVGRAGKLLDEALAEAGIAREDTWVSNVVKRRPVRAQGGRLANRAPTRTEVRACLPILETEIDVIRPRVVVCLGAIAASALIHPQFRLNAERGQWLVPGIAAPQGTRVLATFHPAYILRLRGDDRERVFQLFVADLRLAAEETRTHS